MSDIKALVEHMKNAPANVRYEDLCKVCDHYFGKAGVKQSQGL
jgi:hypothetical protein